MLLLLRRDDVSAERSLKLVLIENLVAPVGRDPEVEKEIDNRLQRCGIIAPPANRLQHVGVVPRERAVRPVEPSEVPGLSFVKEPDRRVLGAEHLLPAI